MSKLKALLISGVALLAACKDSKSAGSNGSAAPVAPAPPAAPAAPPASGSGSAIALPLVGVERANALNEEAKALMYAGKFAEAEVIFRQAYAVIPEPKLMFNLATVLFQQGKFDEAVGFLDQMRALNVTAEQREKADSLFAKIVDECKKQRLPCATGKPSAAAAAAAAATIPATGSAAAAPPTDPAAAAAQANDQGVKLMYDGKYAEAEAQFKKAVALVPEPKYLFNQATALFQLGRFDDAIAVVDKLLAEPKATSDQRAKAEKLYDKIIAECDAQKVTCKRRGAKPTATASTPAAPGGAEEINEKAKKLMFAGSYAEAEPLFQQAIKLVPEPKYLFNLAVSQFQQGKLNETIATLEKLRANKPTADLLAKADKLLAKVTAECKTQGTPCTGVK